MTIRLDGAWCEAHPLPPLRLGLDKEVRGQVLVVGGSRKVPGATILTGEAALRTGAGKVQLATIDLAAVALGITFPESAIIPLPTGDDGEISASAFSYLDEEALRCDALVVGPGMKANPQLAEETKALIERLPEQVPILLDAGAITAIATLPNTLRRSRPIIVTPHHGELAKLEKCDIAVVDADPAAAARGAADRYSIAVVLKSADTFIASPGEPTVRYVGEAYGLGTAGSGDVLAGAIAGLLARGMPLSTAIGWGVGAHGAAGRAADSEIAPLGYLARDLLRFLPGQIATS